MKLQNEGTETLCWPLIPPDSHTHSTHHLSLSSETLKTSRVRGRPSVSLPPNRHTARWSRAGRHRCWTVNHYDDERWKINILIWSHRSNTFHMFNYVLVDVTKRLTDRRMRGFHSRRCENEALSVGAVPPSSLRPELSDLFSHRGHVTDFRLVRWDCRGQQEPGGPDPTTLPPECRCPAVHFLHRALLACLWNRVLQEGARNLTVSLLSARWVTSWRGFISVRLWRWTEPGRIRTFIRTHTCGGLKSNTMSADARPVISFFLSAFDYWLLSLMLMKETHDKQENKRGSAAD